MCLLESWVTKLRGKKACNSVAQEKKLVCRVTNSKWSN